MSYTPPCYFSILWSVTWTSIRWNDNQKIQIPPSSVYLPPPELQTCKYDKNPSMSESLCAAGGGALSQGLVLQPRHTLWPFLPSSVIIYHPVETELLLSGCGQSSLSCFLLTKEAHLGHVTAILELSVFKIREHEVKHSLLAQGSNDKIKNTDHTGYDTALKTCIHPLFSLFINRRIKKAFWPPLRASLQCVRTACSSQIYTCCVEMPPIQSDPT